MAGVMGQPSLGVVSVFLRREGLPFRFVDEGSSLCTALLGTLRRSCRVARMLRQLEKCTEALARETLVSVSVAKGGGGSRRRDVNLLRVEAKLASMHQRGYGERDARCSQRSNSFSPLSVSYQRVSNMSIFISPLFPRLAQQSPHSSRKEKTRKYPNQFHHELLTIRRGWTHSPRQLRTRVRQARHHHRRRRPEQVPHRRAGGHHRRPPPGHPLPPHRPHQPDRQDRPQRPRQDPQEGLGRRRDRVQVGELRLGQEARRQVHEGQPQ
mmetsp:Transcript_3228/g.9273  ORF Transcript_3228/g.9273 Transcript_3228/m.9273 type:complete len:267 (-) Transcript_3228:169-969(-)